MIYISVLSMFFYLDKENLYLFKKKMVTSCPMIQTMLILKDMETNSECNVGYAIYYVQKGGSNHITF